MCFCQAFFCEYLRRYAQFVEPFGSDVGTVLPEDSLVEAELDNLSSLFYFCYFLSALGLALDDAVLDGECFYCSVGAKLVKNLQTCIALALKLPKMIVCSSSKEKVYLDVPYRLLCFFY